MTNEEIDNTGWSKVKYCRWCITIVISQKQAFCCRTLLGTLDIY